MSSGARTVSPIRTSEPESTCFGASCRVPMWTGRPCGGSSGRSRHAAAQPERDRRARSSSPECCWRWRTPIGWPSAGPAAGNAISSGTDWALASGHRRWVRRNTWLPPSSTGGSPRARSCSERRFRSVRSDRSLPPTSPRNRWSNGIRRPRRFELCVGSGSARWCCGRAPLADPEPERVTDALLEGIRRTGVGRLPWSEPAKGVRQRIEFLRRIDQEWPDVSDAGLEARLSDRARRYLAGLRRLEDLRRLDWTEVLLSGLSWERRAALDRLAPTHVRCRAGRVCRWTTPTRPPRSWPCGCRRCSGSARRRPWVAGQVPLTLHLLSPARRPVQVTRDLAGFWRTTYFEVTEGSQGAVPQASLARRPARGRSRPGGPNGGSDGEPERSGEC